MNFVRVADKTYGVNVLIDTWWNVNNIPFTFPLEEYCVLIDTWWNVNYTATTLSKAFSGFNRYMVECEL